LSLATVESLENEPLPTFGGKTGVIVLCPNPYSLYTITVVELLRRSGVEIGAIIILRLFNMRRLISEFRRDGRCLLKKIWKKAFLKSAAYGKEPFETIVNFMQINAIT
jgi:hypothetical protein